VTTTCATSRSDRVIRAIASIFLAGFALSAMGENLWCAIPAGICASFLMIGAITGWCPTDLFKRDVAVAPNAFGFPEAKDSLTKTTNQQREQTKTGA